MLVNHFNGEFPYITIENVYDSDELEVIWEELNFLCYKKNFLPPDKSGTARDNGEILKRNSCIWMDEFYSDRKHSNILELNRKAINFESQEKIFVKRFDEFINILKFKKKVFVKLDVQGYELEVLKGFGNYINQVDYILTEVSYQEAYKGQPFANEIIKFLEENNFFIIKKNVESKYKKKIFQQDILFERKKKI